MILLYISDDYLRSVNCMYEASQALKVPEKVVIIIRQGSNIFGQADKEALIAYWEMTYKALLEKNIDFYCQEIEDTKIALNTIVPLIDFLKQGNRMNDEALDLSILVQRLEVDVKYPTVLTRQVFNWIANSSQVQLFDVLVLIDDLYRSTSVVFSEYPNIPDEEQSYLFKAIVFTPNMRGINLTIVCTDIKSGKEIPFEYPRLVSIEENAMRSSIHSKFYFYCENPAKKQRVMELSERKKYLNLKDKDFSKEDQKLLFHRYIDTYRITIHF